jgi:hypothetical protein
MNLEPIDDLQIVNRVAAIIRKTFDRDFNSRKGTSAPITIGVWRRSFGQKKSKKVESRP